MFGAYAPPKLDVDALRLEDEGSIAMARVIAEETERERELQRKKYPDVPPQPGKGNLGRGLLGDGSYSYADTQRWDTLLTFGECVFRCSKRTGARPVEVLEFAMDQCRPAEPWPLFWYSQFLEQLTENVQGGLLTKVSAAVNEKALALDKKIREGAQRGGRKSAETRRKTARIPADHILLDERRKLLDTGKEERTVASILATRWSVTPDAVRRRVNAALKRE